MKTLTFVDADANANAGIHADAGGSTIALPERCSGELIKIGFQDGGYGGHFGFLIGMILAIFHLQPIATL